MDAKKIEQMLADLNIEELNYARQKAQELIDKANSVAAATGQSTDDDRRHEYRFTSNVLGNLVRVTDVRPGEQKEFTVTISDISRNGMRLRVDPHFLPSRIVELTFASPGGRIKHRYLELIRVRRMSNRDGAWLELGCTTVDDEAVQRLKLQDDRIARMRKKLQQKNTILVYVVGSENDQTRDLTARLNKKGYQTRQIDSVTQMLVSTEKLSGRLAVFVDGAKLNEDRQLLEEVINRPKELAVLAIVENVEQRFNLFRAGLDECILRQNVDEMLTHSVKRALIGHAVRQSIDSRAATARALVISQNAANVNLLNYQLEENGFTCQTCPDVAGAKAVSADSYDLVFADCEASGAESFAWLIKELGGVLIVALCENAAAGHAAIAAGATEYLCMPPNKEDLRIILENAVTRNEAVQEA